MIHRFVPEKVLFNHRPAVPQAQDKLRETMLRVHLHNVPQDWPPADLNQRLRTKLGFLAHTRTLAAT